MVSSYHSKVRSAPNKGDTFLLFGTWTLVSFLHAGAQQKLFQGRGSFVELGQKHTQKKASQGKVLGTSSPTVKNYISDEKNNPKMDTIWDFCPKLGHFFRLLAHLSCCNAAKVSTVNSGLTKLVDVERLHWFSLSLAMLCLQRRYRCSAFLY